MIIEQTKAEAIINQYSYFWFMYRFLMRRDPYYGWLLSHISRF